MDSKYCVVSIDRGPVRVIGEPLLPDTLLWMYPTRSSTGDLKVVHESAVDASFDYEDAEAESMASEDTDFSEFVDKSKLQSLGDFLEDVKCKKRMKLLL